MYRFAGFSNLDDYDFESVWGLLENGLDLLEDGKKSGEAVMKSLQEVVGVSNAVETLTSVFNYLFYGSEEFGFHRMMNLNVPLLRKYQRITSNLYEHVSKAETHPTSQPAYGPDTGGDVGVTGGDADGKPAVPDLEALKEELLTGTSAKRGQEIEKALFHAWGQDEKNQDAFYGIVKQAQAAREKMYGEYDERLLSWLEKTRDTVDSGDFGMYVDLMGYGVSKCPEVVQRYGKDIRGRQEHLKEMLKPGKTENMRLKSELSSQLIEVTDQVNELLDAPVSRHVSAANPETG